MIPSFFIEKYLNICEFIDRFIIDHLYMLHGEDVSCVFDEWNEFLNGLSRTVEPESQSMLKGMVLKLLMINSKIWGLESTIRMGSKCQLPLEEIGRRTIEIRDLNRLRGELKTKIVQFMKENICQTESK